MSEGCLGVLQAYQLLQQQQQTATGATEDVRVTFMAPAPPPADPRWLAFAVKYGEFLLSAQAADGSIAGEWGWGDDSVPGMHHRTRTRIHSICKYLKVAGRAQIRQGRGTLNVFTELLVSPT